MRALSIFQSRSFEEQKDEYIHRNDFELEMFRQVREGLIVSTENAPFVVLYSDGIGGHEDSRVLPERTEQARVDEIHLNGTVGPAIDGAGPFYPVSGQVQPDPDHDFIITV